MKWIQLIIVTSLVSYASAAQGNPFKAPLYWSVYENQIVKEQANEVDVHISEDEWLANIEWVDDNLKEYGFNMICIDGWGDVTQINSNGYRTSHSRHWAHDYAWWSDYLQKRGMRLGMYGNPLWLHVDDHDTNTVIAGTGIPVSSLKNNEEHARFPWVQVDRPGAEEYIKGYVRYYASIGVRFYRIDFLSWFENGQDRWFGRVGPDRPREHYELALRWIREAAEETGMFVSLVMPHLNNEAELEQKYGHMIRINDDAAEGSWHKWSDYYRGERRSGWSVYANAADGLTYWSYIAGRNRMILDPDFIRLNTFGNTDEKMSVISYCLLAGAPVTAADQFNTIGSDIWLYANREMLELNDDGFVGAPLTNEPTSVESQIWTGQMSNGDWIIGMFNRENKKQVRHIDFSRIGLEKPVIIRDLWTHCNLGKMTAFSADIPAHGCRVVRLYANSPISEQPEAMYVAAIDYGTNQCETGEIYVSASVNVLDTAHQAVSGATVCLQFDGSFSETAKGITDQNGIATIKAETPIRGDYRMEISIRNIQHGYLSYAGNLNLVTNAGFLMHTAGTFTNWKLLPMRYDHDAWRLDAALLRKGEHTVKFADTPDFSGRDWGNAKGLNGIASETTGGDSNIVVSIPDTGLYDITFDDRHLTYSFQLSSTQTAQEQIYMAGTFSNWKCIPMQFNGKRWISTAVFPAGTNEMKFLNTPDFSDIDWGDAEGMNGSARISTGGKPNIRFTLPQPGAYSIIFHDISGEYRFAPLLSDSIARETH